jgi:Surface antigen variable number repeat
VIFLGLLLTLAVAGAGTQAPVGASTPEDPEALHVLANQVAQAPSYEGWVKLGLAYARQQQMGAARQALDSAIALDPRQATAWIERGGLAFMEKDYAAAARDLEAALRLTPEDAYARDLLASSLQLAGRSDEALGQWNRIGQPRLGEVRLTGLVHTRERLVQRELRARPGDLLQLDDLRASRQGLAELGIFERVTLRTAPKGGGVVDLEGAFVERHGFAASSLDFVLGTAVQAVQGRVRVRYTNLAGLGLSLGGEYRFQKNRPEVSLFGDIPRPFGLPATLRVLGFRGRQGYDVDGEFTRRARGFQLGARHVQGPRVVLELGFDARERQFSLPRPDVAPGWVAGPRLAGELRILERYRQRLDARGSLFWAPSILGARIRYTRAELGLVYKLHLAAPDGSSIEPSMLAWQVKGGHVSAQTPLDEQLAAGGSPEMTWPLRGRRMYQDGRLGASTPLGRSLLLSNIEWRRRLYKGTVVQLGVVAFYDAAWQDLVRGGQVEGRASGCDPGSPCSVDFHDIGLGLRFGFRGGPLLRFDWGHGLTDGRDELSIGLGYFF